MQVILYGDHSQKYQYLLDLADDKKTILIEPVNEFSKGEKVYIKIYYKEILIIEYNFNISSKEKYNSDEDDYKEENLLSVPLIPDFIIPRNKNGQPQFFSNIFVEVGIYRIVNPLRHFDELFASDP